jgi:hypothetical protein
MAFRPIAFKIWSIRPGRFPWPVWLAIGLILLPGRYQWSPGSQAYSWRGLLCSAFFVCILIPLIDGLVQRFAPDSRWRSLFTGAVTLLLTLPYRWLGLNRWYYYRNKPEWIDWSYPGIAPPKLEWFPRASLMSGAVPFQVLFFLALVAAILGGGWCYVEFRRWAGRPVSRAAVATAAGLLLLIVPETWLHLSLRSPSSYSTHFTQPASQNFWYHELLFENGTGAVNGDYFLFRSIEDVFLAPPRSESGLIIQRPFPLYLSSQLSSFVNPFYIMIAMNIVCWLAAALALRDYASAHFGAKVGTVAAFLTASGPGFICFVAQPPTYLWGFSAMALVIWAHWRICCRDQSSLRDYLLFSGILALSFLTYDLFALLAYLVGYELLFRRSWKKILAAGGIALAIYFAFGLLAGSFSTIVRDTTNSRLVDLSLGNLWKLARSSPLALGSYSIYFQYVPEYIGHLGNAFFVFPILAAAIGVFVLNTSRELKLIGLLLLPSAAGFTLLHFGQTRLAHMPRLVFTAYVAVYILCGIFVSGIAQRAGKHISWAFPAAAGIAVAFHAILTNADVFGLPWLYYLLFNESSTGAGF